MTPAEEETVRKAIARVLARVRRDPALEELFGDDSLRLFCEAYDVVSLREPGTTFRLLVEARPSWPRLSSAERAQAIELHALVRSSA